MANRYAFESITVSTAVKTLTQATITNMFPVSNFLAKISVATANIRFRYDGGNPSSTVGHFLGAGASLDLDSLEDIMNFKAIRDTGSAVDAILTVTYKDEY